MKDKRAETVASFLHRMIARLVIIIMFEMKYLHVLQLPHVKDCHADIVLRVIEYHFLLW